MAIRRMITPTDNDDPQFITLANGLVNAAITTYQPAEVYLIRIDSWFDTKWLNFSGKTIGTFGVWQRPITIPPFHPHRVLAESHWSTVPDSSAFTITPAAPLHIAQPSQRNFTRAIAKVSPSAVFFWYSSSTRTLDRGSTMLYRTHQMEVFSWYTSFYRSTTWQIDRHHGISLTEIEYLFQCA